MKLKIILGISLILSVELVTYLVFPSVACDIKQHTDNWVPSIYLIAFIVSVLVFLKNILKGKVIFITTVFWFLISLVIFHGLYSLKSITCCPGG
jgi:hypothetical protein